MAFPNLSFLRTQNNARNVVQSRTFESFKEIKYQQLPKTIHYEHENYRNSS